MTLKPAISIALCCVLGACATATQSSFDYSPPTFQSTSNEIVIDDDYDAVWNRLVAALAKSFFVVNNIAKESRLINVSFSTNSPEDYIDCGLTSRSFTDRDDVETFEYQVAGDSTYKTSGTGGGNMSYWFVNARDTSLDGRINIYVAPQDDKTIISVNARYVFDVNVSVNEFRRDGYGQVYGPFRRLDLETDFRPLSFSTNEKSSESTGGAVCYSNGDLEASILDLAS